MPVINDIGISKHTKMKEDGLERILSMHMRIVRNIISRGYAEPVYHWWDINAGSGNNPDCHGSPLVFLNTARRLEMPYRATFIEKNEHNIAALRRCVGSDCNITVLHGDNFELLPQECARLNGRRWRLGMIYHDPNGEPNFDLLASVFRLPALKHIDILIYLSGTTLKRIRHLRDKTLLDYLGLIDKTNWMVRDISATGQWQWTFLYGSNWKDHPDYPQAGFHRIDTDKGAQILHVLATTKAERLQKHQTSLFDDTYSTYSEYLGHPRYRSVRDKAIARSGGVCERCKYKPVTEVHHLRYPKWGTFESDASGLLAVCHECHCEIEGKRD